jgi:hypothetical protein
LSTSSRPREVGTIRLLVIAAVFVSDGSAVHQLLEHGDGIPAIRQGRPDYLMARRCALI